MSAGALQVPNGDDAADFGDFVSNEDEELDLEEIVEPWHKYDMKTTPHVFYPICVGEVLNKRYLVEHKIGSGGFSTDSRDVALKVMSLGEWGENEARMQGEIHQNVHDTSHLVTSLTTFLLPGNGCQHRVLVFPLMGPCLQPSILRNMPIATRMSAAKQLLEALENLHKGGIIHHGTVCGGMVPLHDLSRSAKYKALGRPLKQIIPFVDLWKEGELVGPAKIPENLRTEEFYLGDFASRLSTNAILLPGPTSSERCLGPLPEEWKGLYTHPGSLDSWYDQQKTSDPGHDLASTIAYFCPEADPVEQKHVHSIMSSVFSYYPENRLTATQLLQDPSFRAIMHKYGC
ncbi:protein kinase [Histoplasma capsulatum H143]|uniref:Protein kinase n=1 Tax=Ajellomyces capsulatus (strain H143) TaxID=544712 RepID=C6HSL0_AJECH|nr:protein kinase [Histoplasma capsulatum H143]